MLNGGKAPQAWKNYECVLMNIKKVNLVKE